MTSEKTPNNREEVRERLRKEREKELRKERTRRGVLIGGIGTAAVLAVGGATWGIMASRPEPVEQGEQLVPTKITEHGAFHIGSAGEVIEEAEPTGATRMDMFIDPQCPACGSVDRAIKDRVDELLANEELDLYLTPTAFMNDQSADDYSNRAVNALVTIAEESPAHFLAFMNRIFEQDFQPTTGRPVSDSELSDTAVGIGVPQEVADLFAKGHYIDWIEEHTETQLNDRPDLFADGFSTPSVFFNVSYDEEGTASGFTKVQFTSQDPLESFEQTYNSVQ